MKKIISIVLSAFILSLSVFGAAGEEKVSLSLKYAADDLSMDTAIILLRYISSTRYSTPKNFPKCSQMTK